MGGPHLNHGAEPFWRIRNSAHSVRHRARFETKSPPYFDALSSPRTFGDIREPLGRVEEQLLELLLTVRSEWPASALVLASKLKRRPGLGRTTTYMVAAPCRG